MNAHRIALNLTSALILLIAVTIGAAIGALTSADNAANATPEPARTVVTACSVLCGGSVGSGGHADNAFSQDSASVAVGNTPAR